MSSGITLHCHSSPEDARSQGGFQSSSLEPWEIDSKQKKSRLMISAMPDGVGSHTVPHRPLQITREIDTESGKICVLCLARLAAGSINVECDLTKASNSNPMLLVR